MLKLEDSFKITVYFYSYSLFYQFFKSLDIIEEGLNLNDHMNLNLT